MDIILSCVLLSPVACLQKENHHIRKMVSEVPFKISPDQIQQMSSYWILFHYYLHLCAMSLPAHLLKTPQNKSSFSRSMISIQNYLFCCLFWVTFVGFFFLLFRWGFFNPFTCRNFIKFYQKQRFLKGFSEASPVPANLVRQNKKVHINPTYKNPRKDVLEKHPPTNLLHISCWKSKAQFELLCFHLLFWRATLKEKVSVPCLKACEEPAWRIVGSGSLLTLLLDKKRAWRCWWWQSREGILALYRKFLILLISMWHESQ